MGQFSSTVYPNPWTLIERQVGDRTTSEGQAYALCFALVANEHREFELLLSWTINNLALGDLRSRQPADPLRAPLLLSMEGMRRALQTGPSTLERVDTVTGAASGKTPSGFTAVLLPYLTAQRETALAERLLLQLQATQQQAFFSRQSAYYDQMLALFGLGFIEKRFRFNVQGRLTPSWVSERC